MIDETPSVPEIPPMDIGTVVPLVDPSIPPSPTVELFTQVAEAAERADAAATRRRWITLAELVGVAGLVIAALSLWMSWSDRRADDQARQAEQSKDSKARTLVMLKGTSVHNGNGLEMSDAGHDVQSVDIVFPAALGLAVEKNADTTIEANRFARKLLSLTDGGPDEMHGRLPVMITAHYWDADVAHRDTAIYDVAWQTNGRVLQGRILRVKSLRLRERTSSTARLDAIWEQEKPKIEQ